MGIGTPITKLLHGSATWDAGSLVDGAGETKAVTVTGAVLGDFVLVSLNLDVQEMVVSAHVSADNTVEVRLQNETGGTIDLASTTVNVVVIKL